MQEVEAMCNRVVIINKGKIVANDAIEKLQQKLVGEVVITVEFKNPINESGLKAIKEVLFVKQKGNKYTVKANSDVREQISMAASANGWILLSMNLDEDSLENVFQKLTANSK
jgi:ABC-2 type transport system ATP-binding protein